MLAQLLEEKQTWQTTCREVVQDRDKVLKILAEQDQRVRELETERDGQRHEIHQLNETVSRLRRECEALQKAKLDSENEVSDWVTITRKRDEMVKALKEECVHLRVAEQDAQQDRAELAEQLRQRDVTIGVLNDDCAHLRSAKVQMDTELKAAKLRYDTFNLACRGKDLEEARAALKERDCALEERDSAIARLQEDRQRMR